MAKGKYIVEGYRFISQLYADEADKEAKAIKYIISNTDMGNTDTIYLLYKKMIEENMFSTPVGLKFLKEIQDSLISLGKYEENQIPSIPVNLKKIHLNNVNSQNNDKKNKHEMKKLKAKYKNSVIINIILIALVVVMFFVARNSNNVNILNYEKVILDKYSSWAEELQEKESELKQIEESMTSNVE